MKQNKLIIVLLILILLITGCSRKDKSMNSTPVNKESNNTATEQNKESGGKESNTKQKVIKGRYVETELTLPEGIGQNVNIQLCKKNGMPHLYVCTYDEKSTVTSYQMTESGKWTEDTPKWLKYLSFQFSGNHLNLFDGPNGGQYLYYDNYESNGFRGKLLYSNDGTTYEELHPEGWEDIEAPVKVTVMEDGTLAALFENNEVNFYDKDHLKIRYSITGTEYHSNILSLSDQSIILGQKDKNEKIIGIDVYDTSDKYNKTNYPFQSTLPGNSFLDINENKDIILCNADGIHILEQGTSLWQTVIDGNLTCLSMPTLWTAGFTAGSAGTYYILYHSVNGNGYSLMKYTYDKTIDSIPSTELSIYSLKDNPLLRQAAIIFQRKHPEVKISFTIAMSDEEFEKADKTIKDDYIRAFNTELLAGGGTDLIVLDGLPADSFVEKGVLSDVSDVVMPMIDNGELYTNIMNNYVKNQKIYYVPVSYYINLLYGKDMDAGKITTLEVLSAYAKSHMDTSLLGAMTPNDFIDTFSPYLLNKIMDEKGIINREKLITVLNELKIIADNCGIVDEYPDENEYGRYRTTGLVNDLSLCLNSCNSFQYTNIDIGLISQLNGSYTTFEHSFTPNLEFGINNASTKQELCKEFLTLVLSEEIQKYDYNDGFPVNKKGLIECSLIDRSNVGFGFKSDDGKEYKVSTISKEQMEDFIKDFSEISVKCVADEEITAVLKEETGEFLKGNRSADETADSILNKTQIYLSE